MCVLCVSACDFTTHTHIHVGCVCVRVCVCVGVQSQSIHVLFCVTLHTHMQHKPIFHDVGL